jgi:hypothetical protein
MVLSSRKVPIAICFVTRMDCTLVSSPLRNSVNSKNVRLTTLRVPQLVVVEAKI